MAITSASVPTKERLPLPNHFYKHNEKLGSELAIQKKKHWVYYYYAFA